MIRYVKHYYGSYWDVDNYMYDKAFDPDEKKWAILTNTMTSPVTIKKGLTEAEADAFIKLLRS